jgi:hypothetical protein
MSIFLDISLAENHARHAMTVLVALAGGAGAIFSAQPAGQDASGESDCALRNATPPR